MPEVVVRTKISERRTSTESLGERIIIMDDMQIIMIGMEKNI